MLSSTGLFRFALIMPVPPELSPRAGAGSTPNRGAASERCCRVSPRSARAEEVQRRTILLALAEIELQRGCARSTQRVAHPHRHIGDSISAFFCIPRTG